MITGINCWAEYGRATAVAHLDYSLSTGELKPEYCYLSVYFDGAGPFIRSEDFDEETVNARLPDIGGAYPALLDTWLRDYVRKLDEFVNEFGVPEPRKETT